MEVQTTNDKINELEQSFLKFARGVLSHMERWIRAEGLTGFNYFAHSFGENSYNRWGEVTTEYGTLLQGHIQDLLAMEETQQCLQRHIQADVLLPSLRENKKTEAIENVPQDGSLPQQTEQQVVLDLLVPLLESINLHDTLFPADEQLLAQYRRLITLWSDSFERVDITFPLVNFSCDAKESQPLSIHLFLRPLTPADKTALWNDDAKNFTFSEPPLDAHTLMSLSWKLSGTYAFLKNGLSNSNTTKQEVLHELGDIMTALRLLRKGDVGTPAIYEKNHTPVLWQGVRMVNVLGNQQVRQFPLSPFQYYELSEHEIPPLKELSKALHQLRTGHAQVPLYGDMAVALRRFNQSYNRGLPEDQIIDLTIALEGSLLADLRDELNYRLSLRGTALLAPKGKWEPNKSQALLKAMYEIRSNIVHNGRLLTDLEKDMRKLQRVGIESRDFAQWCEEIVRDVLKEYVLREAKGQSLKQVNEELDKYIVESLELQSHTETHMTNE
jgi:Apea-like HEPN